MASDPLPCVFWPSVLIDAICTATPIETPRALVSAASQVAMMGLDIPGGGRAHGRHIEGEHNRVSPQCRAHPSGHRHRGRRAAKLGGPLAEVQNRALHAPRAGVLLVAHGVHHRHGAAIHLAEAANVGGHTALRGDGAAEASQPPSVWAGLSRALPTTSAIIAGLARQAGSQSGGRRHGLTSSSVG